jgi:hypothetical protein
MLKSCGPSAAGMDRSVFDRLTDVLGQLKARRDALLRYPAELLSEAAERQECRLGSSCPACSESPESGPHLLAAWRAGCVAGGDEVIRFLQRPQVASAVGGASSNRTTCWTSCISFLTTRSWGKRSVHSCVKPWTRRVRSMGVGTRRRRQTESWVGEACPPIR